MLAKRIIKMFFGNRQYVAGALWNIAITVVLFVAFLGDQTANTMYFWLGVELDSAAVVVGTVFGGLVSVISVTSCLGALQIIVEDWEHAAKDFHVSPTSRKKVGQGYLLGAMAVSAFITTASVLICVAYMSFLGGGLPNPIEVALLLLTTILIVTSATTFIYFIILCVKSPSTFSAFSGMMSSLIGFMMGVYVPIVALPEGIQWFVRLFPLTHGAAMFRTLLADRQLATLFASTEVYGYEELLERFRVTFALAFDYGAFVSDFWFSAAYLAASSVVFYVLCVIMSRKKTTHVA